jgi:hypothetical protein
MILSNNVANPSRPRVVIDIPEQLKLDRRTGTKQDLPVDVTLQSLPGRPRVDLFPADRGQFSGYLNKDGVYLKKDSMAHDTDIFIALRCVLKI